MTWLLLQECLFVLICDDSEEVSSDAKAFFRLVLSSGENDQLEHDTTEIFSRSFLLRKMNVVTLSWKSYNIVAMQFICRLVEKLPQVMLSNEESLSLLHTRKLLAVTYFCSPRLISDYLLLSPVWLHYHVCSKYLFYCCHCKFDTNWVAVNLWLGIRGSILQSNFVPFLCTHLFKILSMEE